MRIRTKSLFLFLAVGLLCLGCTSVRRENITSGLFENDLETLHARYGEVEVGKTTVRDLENIGWNFRVQNIERIQGADALKKIFGDNLFQGVGDSPERIICLLNILNAFEVFVVPYVITTTRDHYTAGRTEHSKIGTEGRLVFLCQNNIVVYKAENLSGIDRSSVDTGFARGLLDWLEKNAGLVKDAASFIPK